MFEREITRRQSGGELVEWQDTMAEDGSVSGYRYTLGVPINATYEHLLVNYLEWWEIDKHGHQKVFTWVTNLPITPENVFELARSARARWRVENEVFNVLKNQGYEFGRNYGHGKKYLSSTLAALTMLAFPGRSDPGGGVPGVQGGPGEASHEEVVVGEDALGDAVLPPPELGNDDDADDRSGGGRCGHRSASGIGIEILRPTLGPLHLENFAPPSSTDLHGVGYSPRPPRGHVSGTAKQCNSGQFAGNCWAGDHVLAPDGAELYVGEITSDARYENGEWVRDVTWANGAEPVERESVSPALHSRLRTLLTVTDIFDLASELALLACLADGPEDVPLEIASGAPRVSLRAIDTDTARDLHLGQRLAAGDRRNCSDESAS